jgi:hypothetical protein
VNYLMRISEVRLGPVTYRVVQPAASVRHLALHYNGSWMSMYVDRDAALALYAAWDLVAHSPHSLVYLPARANPAPSRTSEAEPLPEPLDLVLLHHSLQFPTARWKELRSRIGRGRPQATSITDLSRQEDEPIDYQRRGFEEFRDHLRFNRTGHTLFVVGSQLAFREHRPAIRTLLDGTPPRTASDHSCVELRSGTRGRPATDRHDPGYLHIEYRTEWPNQPD